MAYNVTGQVIYTPSISTVVNNGSAISLTVDLSNYELRDNYGNGGKVYFPNPSSQYTQFGEDFTIYCYSSSDCSGSSIATLTATLNRIDSRKASITFTLPTGTRSFRISESFTTLVSSEYYDYTNFGGYISWGAPNRYDTGSYYWKSKEPYTACGAPTSCSLSSTLSTGNVTLSWSGASAGTSNSITGYKIQRCESSDGSNWGSWADLTTVNSTSTSASLTVSPPSTAGNYYKYRVLTMGSAGSSYYSGYKESTNTLRRNWTACGAPTAVSVSSTNVAPNTSVTLSWSGATSGYGNAIAGYQVYRSTSSSGTYEKIADISSTSTSGSCTVSAPSGRNASYYYKVLTVGSVSGFSSGQSSATATLTCSWGDVGAPSGVKLSATYTTSGNNVTLSWNAASNATNNAVTGYHIYRDGSYYGATTSTSMSVPAHSTAGSSYTYTVYTLGTYSNSGASSGVTVYTYGNPSAPTTVTVSNASPEAGSTISLAWRDAAAGGYNAITGYKIYRATSADGTYSHLTTVSSSSTSGSCDVEAPGSMGGTYYFKVVTVGARSESGMSAYVSVTAKTYTKCSTPSNLALETTVSSGSNATLSWEASTSGANNTVNGYQIQRRESSDGTTYDDWASLATISSASTTSLSVSPPSVAGHYYQYRIRATGSAGESFYSDWKLSSNRLYRDYTKCTAPTSFSLSSALSREDVTLSWNGAGDGFYNTVVDYEIQRCESSNGSTWGEWGVPTTTSGTSITVSPPSTAGNSYKYRIRVRGSAGSSYYSDWVESSNTLTKDYTRCIQPSFCALSANTSKVDVTLSWGTSGNGDGNTFVGYEVQRSGSADRSTWNDWETIVSKTTSTQISVSPPTASGYAYKFRVRGLGSVGDNYHSLFTESDGFLMLGTVDIGSFTDTVLTPGVTLVKAVHITELQNAVNIIATIYGSQQFSFSEVVPYSESGCSYIKDWTSHITEIRNAIDSISSSHEDWIAIPENKPLASVIQQIRSILKSMQ